MTLPEFVSEDMRRRLADAGFAIVPRTPTQPMMDAGLYQASHDATWADVYSSWKDMIAAAEAAD